jgi:outer membrane receptor protein involved in Fe transport
MILPLGAQEQAAIRGTLMDATGAAIAGAEIEFRSSDARLSTTSDVQGNFTLPDAAAAGALFIRYPGFAPVRMELTAESSRDGLQIHLVPAPTNERIVVTPGDEDRIAPTPSSQYSIASNQIESSGTLALDDTLRQVPGFSLFRRSGSLFANPTSQGISLRGMGASGSSRAVVLLDGVPLNDPFGAWVYWERIPNASVASMTVLNGGSSDTYGGGALGGAVNIETVHGKGTFGHLEAAYGNEDTQDVSFDAGTSAGRWGVSAAGQALRTRGYVLVPENQRGAVDTPAGTGDLAGSVELSRQLGEEGRFFVRAMTFGESRKNGTPLQINSTQIPELDIGTDWTNATAGIFSARLYGSDEVFHQNFTSISADRNTEALTNVQRSPSQQIGFTGQWRRTFARRHTVTLGVEDHDVRGHSFETTYNAGRPTALVDAGGRQRITGFFFQDAFYFARNWLLTVGGREDTWLNSRGFSNRTPLPTGVPAINNFANRTENAFSPRVSLLRTFSNSLALSASVYRAFRAPTLNELYRNFRVGNVVTNANANLTAERLTGGEAGLSFRRWQQKLTMRGNFFWSDITNPVANVTLSTTPALITRQRQNLGVVRGRGVELGAEIHLTQRVELSGEYILTDNTVLRFPANTLLEGLRIPEVPKNQVNLALSYSGRVWDAGLQGRFVGKAFDDDLNTLPLARFATVDGEVSRQVLPHARLFLAMQNLTNTRYATAATPVLSLGPPLLVRGGFRIDVR